MRWMAAMGNLGKNGERFTVIRGGLKFLPRLLVVDFDAAAVQSPLRLSPDEVQALTHAVGAGVELGVVTGEDERSALLTFADAGLTVTVLSDGPAINDFERARVRLEHLAAHCRKRRVSLRDVAVIASQPYDCPMLLEAGIAVALETAGYDACVASDAVFPARVQGGFAAAIDAVVTWGAGINGVRLTDRG